MKHKSVLVRGNYHQHPVVTMPATRADIVRWSEADYTAYVYAGQAVIDVQKTKNIQDARDWLTENYGIDDPDVLFEID